MAGRYADSGPYANSRGRPRDDGLPPLFESGEFASRRLARLDLPGKVTPITSADGVDFPASVSTHLAWGNVDPADSYPFSATSTMPLSEPFTIKAPLEQELWGADPATGTFLRLAPTMTSGHGNVFNFRTQYAIESMSPTGCIAWSSDWMGTLGNTDGNTTSCKLGSNPPMACRSDVFVTCPG